MPTWLRPEVWVAAILALPIVCWVIDRRFSLREREKEMMPRYEWFKLTGETAQKFREVPDRPDHGRPRVWTHSIDETTRFEAAADGSEIHPSFEEKRETWSLSEESGLRSSMIRRGLSRMRRWKRGSR